MNNTSNNVPAYRITSDDLPDADKKTLSAIAPLLEALNRSLTAIIATLPGLSNPSTKSSSFTVPASGPAVVKLKLGAPAKEVWVSALTQSGGSISAAYSMASIPTNDGAQLSFFGLTPAATYNFTVRYL